MECDDGDEKCCKSFTASMRQSCSHAPGLLLPGAWAYSICLVNVSFSLRSMCPSHRIRSCWSWLAIVGIFVVSSLVIPMMVFEAVPTYASEASHLEDL